MTFLYKFNFLVYFSFELLFVFILFLAIAFHLFAILNMLYFFELEHVVLSWKVVGCTPQVLSLLSFLSCKVKEKMNIFYVNYPMTCEPARSHPMIFVSACSTKIN